MGYNGHSNILSQYHAQLIQIGQSHLLDEALHKSFLNGVSSESDELAKRARDLEIKIDQFPLKHSILQTPRDYAVWNLLTATEHELLKIEASWHSNLTQSVLNPDHWKNALKHCLRWVYAQSRNWKSFVKPKQVKSPAYHEARDYLDIGAAYQTAETAFKEWRKGIAFIERVSTTSISFRFDEEEARYDVLDHNISSGHRESNQNNDDCSNLSDTALSLLRKIEVEVEDNCLHYAVGQDLFDLLTERNLRRLLSKSQLPQDWAFQGISRLHFNLLWAGLQTLSTIHQALFIQSRVKEDVGAKQLASCLYCLDREDLIGKLVAFSGETCQQSIPKGLDLLS